MFGDTYSREIIETLYVANGKNMEVTLDQFLSGRVPKDEIKVTVVDTSSKSEHIDTTT